MPSVLDGPLLHLCAYSTTYCLIILAQVKSKIAKKSVHCSLHLKVLDHTVFPHSKEDLHPDSDQY